ncbi:unnamed protein product [Linum tenue]|uniref:DUF4283 domain-containing protein n=1 Tax=Linum tenue TaxID=586396 RepID=A0AAV0QVN4_9ROSI|nr:unnamed protein product [Linum tenue]
MHGPSLTGAWTSKGGAARKLFPDRPRTEEWYVADSDSEDVAEAIREDGLEEEIDDEDDPTCPPIHFTTAEKRMYQRPWRSALVVKLLGRSTSYTVLWNRLNVLWAKTGGIQVTNARNGFYLVRFTSGNDFERALTGGPWMIGDHYLTMHLWDKDFDPYSTQISTTLVWARLLDLPIYYFHKEVVMRIGRRIGKPL